MMAVDTLSKPHFVVIGAMKCATSSLHDQLAHQDGFWMSDPKEPNFFSDPANWERGFEWYRSLFEEAPADAICGESSTHYTKLPIYPACAGRVHAALPDAKLIYVMRDPVQRIVSHYIHAWSERDIDDGVSIDDAILSHAELVAYSMYHHQLAPYLECYGAPRILLVFTEHLHSHPQRELERVCAHVGYPGWPVWRESLGSKNVSAKRQRRHPALDAILAVPALQVLRRALMPSSLRDRIKSRWTMKERPVLSPASLKFLSEQLDPDLAKLGALVALPLESATWGNVVADAAPPTWTTDLSPHA